MKELKFELYDYIYTYNNVRLYTGKKDISGKPIIEGNIIEAKLYNGRYWVVKWDEDICGIVLGTMTENLCKGGYSTPTGHYDLGCRKRFKIIADTPEYYCPKYGVNPNCKEKKCEKGWRTLDCYKKLETKI